MTAQHTPGPLMRDNFSVTTFAPAGEKRKTVAICSPDTSLSPRESMERMRANATLFAAATDMLAALKATLERTYFPREEVEAAIAKATGAA